MCNTFVWLKKKYTWLKINVKFFYLWFFTYVQYSSFPFYMHSKTIKPWEIKIGNFLKDTFLIYNRYKTYLLSNISIRCPSTKIAIKYNCKISV